MEELLHAILPVEAINLEQTGGTASAQLAWYRRCGHTARPSREAAAQPQPAPRPLAVCRVAKLGPRQLRADATTHRGENVSYWRLQLGTPRVASVGGGGSQTPASCHNQPAATTRILLPLIQHMLHAATRQSKAALQASSNSNACTCARDWAAMLSPGEAGPSNASPLHWTVEPTRAYSTHPLAMALCARV